MPNRLARATSPYLQQHADNPVDWYPWGEDALARARAENKPILLSIGYSACHWCHVMAHESFEDPDVAAVMNDAFVNIKVDREERPDLDQIYQTAHALLTRRSGGWPLTMFLTPDGEPFFGGTYFPKHGRYGLPGFLELLPKVANAYRQQGDQLAEQNARLTEAMAGLEPAGGAVHWPKDAPALALAALKLSFDPNDGGFGSAPKFPHPAELEFCLRAYASAGDGDALTIVRTTLDHMADGGIHDQLGGGFCRYSVDAQWTIPHFEKMLYDNGPLLALYADLARVTGERRHADVARDIVGWLVREMRAPDGAFYSSLDADSEGEEGRFYVWTPDEARAVTSPDEWAVAAPYWGLDGPPNFEGHAWNLRVTQSLERVAERLAISLPDAQTRLVGARAALFAARAKRIRPGRDDKILTSWNALAIAGLARAARAADEPRWADLAFAAADTLKRTAWRDGRLFATRRGERAELNAYLDDHAFLLAALARTHADAVPARGLRVGARARGRAARTLRGSRPRRLLVHESRPRAPVPPDQARARQRDAGGQRNRGVRAGRVRPPCVRRPLRRRGATRRGTVRARTDGVAGRPFERAGRAFGARRAAGLGPAGGRRRHVQRMAAHAGTDVPPGCARVQPGRRARRAAGARQGRRAGHRGRRVGVRRHRLPAADGIRRGDRGRAAVNAGTGAALGTGAPDEGRRAGAGADSVKSRGFALGIARPGATPGNGAWRSNSIHPSIHGVSMKAVLVSLAGAALLASGAAHAALDNAKAEAMMKKDGCAACHAIDKKLVGPAYVDVAAKYKNDKNAVATLTKKVKEGGSGVWGQIPMPPNAAAPEADIKELVTWILALKK